MPEYGYDGSDGHEGSASSLGFNELMSATSPLLTPTKPVDIGGEDAQDDDPTFPIIPKRMSSDGRRSVSKSVRLRRQGFRSTGNDFAVRTIKRGSEAWDQIIRPFCADIVFRSLKIRRCYSEVSFVPYTCHAAVVFIDLSGYSKIAAAIAHKGAHALSSAVNSYLSQILQKVHSHGGDVVKFAGDAVLVLWEGTKADLSVNVKCAARCVMDLQLNAASYAVDLSQGLVFRTHIGLCCGQIESEVFEASVHSSMQRLYHSVGGEALNEISDVVDMAGPGEICITTDCAQHLDGLVELKEASACQDFCTDGQIMVKLQFDPDLDAELDKHIDDVMARRACARNYRIEEQFIHPNVIRQLSHSAFDPTQIAQMRNLCVLFIAMTSSGSSVNWLMEVQAVLDQNRCPVVQIIDDDKGVHLVAAVNLYEAVPEASILGLTVAWSLLDKHVGCAIGIAAGATFCGVTGSASIACRWDITGPPPVRAARLMQYCLLTDESIAIDQSVYDDPIAKVRMSLLNPGIDIKGTEGKCPVYTFSTATNFAALRVLGTCHGSVHDGAVTSICEHLVGSKSRTAVIVTGPTLTGKKIVCQRAAGCANLVPFLHISGEHRGLLQLAETIATWFKYVDNEEAKTRATNVLNFLNLRHWTRAHDECIKLVTFALESGINACFVVDRIQFLDEFSFSLMRECLHGRFKGNRLRMSSQNVIQRRSSRLSSSSASTDISSPFESGKISFLCVHVPLYNWMDASDIGFHLTRSHRMLHVPIIEVAQAPVDELRAMMLDMSNMQVDDCWLKTYAESSGCCAGYFMERVATSRVLSTKLWSEGKPGYAVTTREVKLAIPAGRVAANKHIKVHQMSPDVAMKFTQVYDELPPLLQTTCKVVTTATRRKFFRLPKSILWEVLNDLIEEGIELDEFNAAIAEMEAMFLVVLSFEMDQEVVSFLNPAFSDIVSDVCTPNQTESMVHALIDRLQAIASSDFRVPLGLASLHGISGNEKDAERENWKKGFDAFQAEKDSLSPPQQTHWFELIHDEMEEAGISVKELLGGDFCSYVPQKNAISSILPMLKIYQGPVTLGQMSYYLSVMFCNTFHEYGIFYGAPRTQREHLSRSNMNASTKYLRQMEHLELFMDKHDLGADQAAMDRERDMIRILAEDANGPQDVVGKAELTLNEFVPQIIEPRRKRLHRLVEKLRRDGTPPDFVLNAEPAIKRAYQALQSDKLRIDAAQDALMSMATSNWKPSVPTDMPIIYKQSVEYIRSKVIHILTPEQLIGFRHQQTVDDLEAFLIVTPLLHELEDGTVTSINESEKLRQLSE